MSSKSIDPVINMVIQNRVDDQMAAKLCFTAYDISVWVQDQGHRERHLNMKHVVHEMWEQGCMGGYNRTLVPTPAGVDAWLYHPQGADISGYKPQARRGVQPASKPMSVQDFYGQGTAMPTSGIGPVPSDATTPSVDEDDVEGDAWKPDARGSLTVPVANLRAIGVVPGDRVRVFSDNGKVMVEKTTSPADDDKVYTVNNSCNARITKNTLEQVGAKQGPNGYEFVIHGDKQVEIKTAG